MRACIAFTGLLGLILGLIDALAPHNVTKFFLSVGILVVIALPFIIYELVHYPLPERPFLESGVLSACVIANCTGIGGTWALTWYFVARLVGALPPAGHPLPLAPGYLIDWTLFTWLTFATLAYYCAILFYSNMYGRD